MDDYKKIRALYEKKGRARYIYHLDINRLMQRVLKRAGLPVWYTEGFNPHMYLTFALPLSLGCESEAEYMDFRLTEDLPFEKICRRFNDSLPEGIHVREAFAPIHKTAEIARADYRIRLQAGCGSEMLKKSWDAFWGAERIEVVKKTKRGMQTVDLKPEVVLNGTAIGEDGLTLFVSLPAGPEKNYNPSLLLDEFGRQTGLEPRIQMLRTRVYCKDGSEFR